LLTLDHIYSHFLISGHVSTDSRRIPKDCIFFALKGENFNGNLYAKEALRKGAAFAIVDEFVGPEDSRILKVTNALKTLQDFAYRYRQEFAIPIIAVTGSNGKTTTKELIAKVLGSSYNVHFTQGNLNNHIGVPLTLLTLKKDHELAIIEMGANHIGEIAELCKIANPTHGMITNIGKAHLEGFGGIEGVKKGKGELYDFLVSTKGVIFYNQSETSTKELIEPRNLQAVVFSKNSKHQGFVDFEFIEKQGDLSFTLDFRNNGKIQFNTQLQGKYNLTNLLNAVCLGIYFHVPFKKIKPAIESYKPSNNRSQIVDLDTNKFFLDAYNANPSSMYSAISNFKSVKHLRKILILGDMHELGEHAALEHKNVAAFAETGEFEKVIYVGELYPNNDFKDVSDLKDWFDRQNYDNCFFLIKGSRGIALERLISS